MESDKECYEVFCGIDVAREIHHAVALDRGGRCLVDRPLPNDEAGLRAPLDELAVHGRVLVVVDQPASIGALAIAVARACRRAFGLGRADRLLPGEPSG